MFLNVLHTPVTKSDNYTSILDREAERSACKFAFTILMAGNIYHWLM
jgi:hypothetical protein